ncbi:SDR family NAD(P)-dependent oxidoreductase [Halalkalibaculum sp. DA3122]|uniref:SDR family NAD(P)-dependent oxidoreductase n=1 Tax=unclassified Halalkalibaculum TaxID=2964617 RepID=UPI0037540E6E
MRLSNKNVLITGGSAGIGKALIEELSVKDITDIAVMGRTVEKLDDLEDQFPSARFLKIQGDVSVLSDVKEASKTIKQEWGSLDILINNAGVVSAGLLEEISDEDILGQINVNLTGLIYMTKHFLPLLKKSDEAAIMNISSGLGYIAMPFYSVYAATKAGVKHFSEAMRRELVDYPIHVMTVYPTSTDTPMMESANTGDMDSPQKVARASIEGLLNGEIEVVLGGQQRIDDIKTNLNDPQKMDEKVDGMYEALRKRAERHRSM